MEHWPWDGDLGHLERDVAAVADDLRTDLDRFLRQARQRPTGPADALLRAHLREGHARQRHGLRPRVLARPGAEIHLHGGCVSRKTAANFCPWPINRDQHRRMSPSSRKKRVSGCGGGNGFPIMAFGTTMPAATLLPATHRGRLCAPVQTRCRGQGCHCGIRQLRCGYKEIGTAPPCFRWRCDLKESRFRHARSANLLPIERSSRRLRGPSPAV